MRRSTLPVVSAVVCSLILGSLQLLAPSRAGACSCFQGDNPPSLDAVIDTADFRPSANATRGQTSKIVSNAAGFAEIPTEQTFEDVPPTHSFYQEIQRLASRNIMQGYPCGGVGEPCISGKPYFRPSNNVTRGQSAKIVANAFYPGCDMADQPLGN